MDAYLQLIICAFDGVDQADEAMAALRRIDDRLEAIKLGNIAVIKKLSDGSIIVRDARDARQALSHIAAPIAGAITWFISQIVGAPAPVAEATAEVDTEAVLTRWMRDGGFPDAALRAVAERSAAGSSALIILVAPAEADTVKSELERLGGHAVEHALDPDLATRLTKT